MILGNLNDINLKNDIPEQIWNALKFVRDNDLNKLDDGRYNIDGDNLFINVMTVDSVSKDSKSCELHRNYADIQILIEGEELMEYATSREEFLPVTEYDATSDFQSINPTGGVSTLILKPNMFAVFYPNEPHKPTCFINEIKTIRKAVLKVHTNFLQKLI